jgi:hypothetical protein
MRWLKVKGERLKVCYDCVNPLNVQPFNKLRASSSTFNLQTIEGVYGSN